MILLHHQQVSDVLRMKNWKSVYIVLCSICWNLYRTKSIGGHHWLFVFNWRKLLPNHTDYFEKFMVHMLHRKMRVNDSFDVSKGETLRLHTRNMENCKKIRIRLTVLALLDEDDSQTQKQLIYQLGDNQQAVFNRLRKMGKILKTDRWVPHELNDRQMEKRKITFDILLARYKRSQFSIVQLQGMKSGFILRI